MIFRKANLLSLAAMAATAAVFTACDESPTSPRAVTSNEARADLQAMAAKVKYFAPQEPGTGMGIGGDLGAGKKSAGPGTGPIGESGCDLEATEYETWDTDTSLAGDVTVQYDTTVSYTSANQPICSFDDETAYQLTSSSSENAMLDTHVKTRMDFPATPLSGQFKLSGSGTVHYKDGYLIHITSIDIVVDLGEMKMKTYVMNLALEKGYTVVLQAAPGTDLMSEEEPGPDDVEVSGPISKDGTVVGYFEVMGDDRVIIRDADKAIIEAHG
jgi:hypothetical protein